MQFQQSDINGSRFSYSIEENGVRIKRKSIASATESFVDFEEVGSRIMKEKSRKIIWLIICGVFLLFALAVFYKRLNGGNIGKGAEVFHLSVSLIFLFVFFVTRKNSVYLTQTDYTNAIEFMGGKSQEKKLDEFIKTLIETRDHYLLEKYSKLDEFLPYNQQYNNLVWLYNLKLLTKEELQKKIADLDALEATNQNGKKNDLTKIMGFRSSPELNEEGEI